MSEHVRQVRDDLDDMRREVEKLKVPQTLGAEACLVKTAMLSSYPTVAGAWYYCEIQRVSGTPSEGDAGTVAGTGRFILAYNVGGQIPPADTLMVATMSRGQYSINYCGAGS